MAKLSNTPEQVAVSDTKRKPVYTHLPEDEDEDDVENRVFQDGNKVKTEQKSPSEGVIDESENDGEFRIEEDITKKDMLFLLLSQAAPITLSFFLSFTGTFTQLIFASHFNGGGLDESTVFAGISLANMFANVSCMSLMIGMSSAVETLASQHNGAKRYQQVGIILWRSIMILGVMLPFIIVTWYFVSNIFHAIGIEIAVCTVIQKYLRIRTFTLPIDVINISYEKYLMALGVVKPSMWCNISFNISLLSLNYIFVFLLKWDYTCLAYSWVISTYFMACVQWGLSWYHPSVQV
jgi:Na+-driven multidrug efflux pump